MHANVSWMPRVRRVAVPAGARGFVAVAAPLRCLAILATLALSAACGARRIDLPTDAGTPLVDAATIHRSVSDACRNVRTMTAEVSLSGRAGGERLGGTVHAGFKRPSSMRLELHAGPFGSLLFVLGADASGATLLLPRDEQVARAPADEILAALTGLALTPADLQAILTGCVVPDPQPLGGRTHQGGWISIDLDGGATLYLQRTGGSWRVRAATRPDARVEYPEWNERERFPSRVRVTTAMPVAVDLQARLAQVETNVDLEDTAFIVTVPADARTISVEQLRQAGPLRSDAP